MAIKENPYAEMPIESMTIQQARKSYLIQSKQIRAHMDTIVATDIDALSDEEAKKLCDAWFTMINNLNATEKKIQIDRFVERVKEGI